MQVARSAILTLAVLDASLLQVDASAEYSCGEWALFTALRLAECPATLDQVRIHVQGQSAPPDSLAALGTAASRLDAFAVVAKLPLHEIELIPSGSIVHLSIKNQPSDENSDHFSVFLGTHDSKGRILLVDGPARPFTVNRTAFERDWSGYILAVYHSSEEAEQYGAQLLRLDRLSKWLRTTSLGGAVLGAVTLLYLLLCHRRALQCKQVNAYLLSGVILTTGCDNVRSSVGPLEVPREIDAGYVPVSGKAVEFLVRNGTAASVHVISTTSSCGCATINAPHVVGSGEAERVTVVLEGSHRPALRRSALVLNTEPLGEFFVNMKYATGDLPQFDPPLVTCERRDNYFSGTAHLWAYAEHPGTIVTLQLDGNSKGMISYEVEPEKGYQIQDQWTVRLEQGLQVIRVRLVVCDLFDWKTGICSFNIIHDGRSSTTTLGLRHRDQAALVIHPKSAAVWCGPEGDEAVGETRIFLVSSEVAGICRIAHAPEYCRAELLRIGPSDWRLQVTICEKPPKQQDIAIIDVECNVNGRIISESAVLQLKGPAVE